MKHPLFCLIVLIIALAVAGCVVSKPNLAGRINGTEITYGAFMDSYRAHYNNFQVLNNRVPDKDENEQIKRQTWTHAAKHVILTNYFRKYGIEVTPQETIDTLKANIPDYIKESPKFMTKGVFDPNIYLQSLLYDSPENLQPLRLDYQEYKIPIMKLQQHLLAGELLTGAERSLVEKILRSKADIEWTMIDSKTINPIVSEEEIQAFYQANPERFKSDPWYSLAWIAVKVTPSKTDIKAGQALADSLYLSLSGGMSWADLSKRPEFSTVITKNSGFVRNLDLDPETYALLSSLEPGMFSKPMPDNEGSIIYQLEERTKSMCSFNTLRIPYLPSQTSIALEKPKADTALKLAQTIGLQDAAEELDYSIQRSGKLTPRDEWIQDAGLRTSILDLVHPAQPGALFAPLYSSSEQSWLVIGVQENRLNVMTKLSDVRETISREISERKRLELAKNLAERIIAGQSDVPPDAEISKMTGLDLDSELLGETAEPYLYQILRRHFLKQKQSSFQIGDLVMIPKVISVFTDKGREIPLAEIRSVFAAYQPSDWFDSWMSDKVAKARISIYIP